MEEDIVVCYWVGGGTPGDGGVDGSTGNVTAPSFIAGLQRFCIPGGPLVPFNWCLCPQGSHLVTPNGLQMRCECDASKSWDDARRACVARTPDAGAPRPDAGVAHRCPAGMTMTGEPGHLRCECATGVWDAAQRACVNDPCSGGATWNVATRSCGCPSGQKWSPTSRRCLSNTCPAGMVLDTSTDKCACAGATPVWSTSARRCEGCPGGKVWNSTACECPGNAPLWNGFVCRGCGPREVLQNGTCVPRAIAGEGRTASRNVTISVVDYNSQQDDYYDVYVNGAFIGNAYNAPGGTTHVNATLQPGENLVELRLARVMGSSTALELGVEPGGFRKQFTGTSNHSFILLAP
jgi:hypothetical protein